MTRAIGVMLIFSRGGAYIVPLWDYRQGYYALNQEGISVTPMWLLSILILALLLSAGLALILLFRCRRI